MCTSSSMTTHSEYGYLNLLKDVLTTGDLKPNRTGIAAKSLFGQSLKFDLRDGFPLLTTKRMAYKSIFKELLFFISGDTNTKRLEEQGVSIWKGNTSRQFLDDHGFTEYLEGDMGPMYGFQWRHWNGSSDPTHDQLSQVIHNVKTDPHSRRHIVSAWNVSQLPEMVLAPCHILFQFNVSSDGMYLDCAFYQRSGDLFLGVPFNIASYALLLTMVAQQTGKIPRHLIHFMGDAHLYETHYECAKTQIERDPHPFPTLVLDPAESIDHYTLDHIHLVNYVHEAALSAPMAV